MFDCRFALGCLLDDDGDDDGRGVESSGVLVHSSVVSGADEGV